MAISNLNLNVRANTARAMRDFKRFSDTLDNKFLLSGLKLDVIRSSLSQINREFQRSIGEQGLASASSLRAAQNQAALLTQTFKGFAAESALAINRDIGTALNSLAVRAGGTMKDVQKTLAASSFISIRLPEDARNKLVRDMMSLQRDMRRSGVSENFGSIAQQFLSGRVQAMDLIGSEDAGAAFIGAQILKRSGGRAQITDASQRSQILSEVVGDPAVIAQFKEMARRTMGYRLFLEDLNTKLFNPEFGLFGSLRKVLGADGRYTTMFDQVELLANKVFGPEGAFTTFFKRIGDVFGIEDPMQPFIALVQFSNRVAEDIKEFFKGQTFTRILRGFRDVFESVVELIRGPEAEKVTDSARTAIDSIGQFLSGDTFKQIVGHVKETFGKIFNFFGDVVKVFSGIFKQVGTGEFNPADIKETIKGIGEGVRKFIKDVGKSIRDFDLQGKEGNFVSDIGSTLFVELGKTAVVLVKELFATLIDKVPEIAEMALPAINKGINTLMTETFGQFAGLAKLVMATMPGPVGMIARASVITDATGGKGSLGALGAIAPFLLAGGGGLAGMGTRAFTGTGGGATAFRTLAAGLMGANPVFSLLAGFAPQILGGVGNAVSGLNQTRLSLLEFPSSRTGQFLSQMGGRAANLARRGNRRLASDLFWLRATTANYLRGAGSLIQQGAGTADSFMQQGLSAAQGRYSTAAGFVRSRASQFMAGFRPPFPHIAVGAPTTRAYNIGQYIRNLPTTLANLPANALTSARSLLSRGASSSARAVSRGLATTSGYLGSVVPLLQNGITSVSQAASAAIGNLGPLSSKLTSSVSGMGSSLSRAGSGFVSSARAATAPIASAGRALGSGVVAFGRIVATQAALASVQIQRAGNLFSLGFSGQSLFTRGKAMVRAGAAFRLFAPTALVGGGVVLGSQLLGKSIGGSVGQQIGGVGAVLGGGISGASTGAMLGSIIPGVGTVVGAVIGGIIGGILPLIDKETRAGVAEFARGIGRWFTDTINWIANGTKENFKKAQDTLSSGLRTAVNGFITVFNSILGSLQLIPRYIISSAEKLPGVSRIPGFDLLKSVANFQIQPIRGNYDGKDFYGPAMAIEARMSGRKPMIVNDGEFVIPAGSGLSTLAGLVGQNLQSTGVINQANGGQPVINVQIALTNNSFVANPDELVNKLRAPVHQIINEAWTRATQTIPSRTV